MLAPLVRRRVATWASGFVGRMLDAMETTENRWIGAGSALSGGSLIVGGVAFALFWGTAPTALNDDVPWAFTLGVHGVGIVALCIGLGGIWLSVRRGSSGQLATVGIAITVLGLLTVFPLLPVGLAVVAWGLRRDGWPARICGVLLVGSMSLAAVTVSYQIVAGAAIAGQDGAPAPAAGWIAWFIVSVLAVAAGLIMLGRERLR